MNKIYQLKDPIVPSADEIIKYKKLHDIAISGDNTIKSKKQIQQLIQLHLLIMALAEARLRIDLKPNLDKTEIVTTVK